MTRFTWQLVCCLLLVVSSAEAPFWQTVPLMVSRVCMASPFLCYLLESWSFQSILGFFYSLQFFLLLRLSGDTDQDLTVGPVQSVWGSHLSIKYSTSGQCCHIDPCTAFYLDVACSLNRLSSMSGSSEMCKSASFLSVCTSVCTPPNSTFSKWACFTLQHIQLRSF